MSNVSTRFKFFFVKICFRSCTKSLTSCSMPNFILYRMIPILIRIIKQKWSVECNPWLMMSFACRCGESIISKQIDLYRDLEESEFSCTRVFLIMLTVILSISTHEASLAADSSLDKSFAFDESYQSRHHSIEDKIPYLVQLVRGSTEISKHM